MDNFPVEEGNEKLSEFKDGIKMTQDELSRALEKNNIVLGLRNFILFQKSLRVIWSFSAEISKPGTYLTLRVFNP